MTAASNVGAGSAGRAVSSVIIPAAASVDWALQCNEAGGSLEPVFIINSNRSAVVQSSFLTVC